MSNDISSKVYLFLAKQGDWATAADKNGDGTVIKSEFRQYMENNYEWNGEDASAKSDLINQFWKEIDTKQSGKLNKKLNNKGALDKNEINTMNNKIQMYEILNNFTSNSIEVPSVVQDRTNWKKSVAESLANKVDAYIKANKSADNLEAYLQEISPEIERKATADYCANQYLNTEMKDIVKKYGYSYADDSTLQGMIDNYISQLSANNGEVPSDEEINETVINIINEYLSTANLKDSDGFDLSQFGYTANDNSPLNDLQKSIIKSNLQKNLQDITNESDYETYKSLYDDAVNQFIESKLADGKFADFATLQNYGIAEFENSDNYKSVKKAISVKAYIDSADFKSAISSAVSSAFADRISNVMTGEVPAYDTLISDIMSKAQNGDFDNADGSLNTEKMQNYIIEQVKSNIAEFYPNGLGDMSLDDLSTMYDALVEAAREKNDAAKVKEAAISYCQAVSKKSTTLAQAVKDVFGAGYAATINQMLSGEIDSKMTELKAKVNEIGDASTFTLASLQGGVDNITITPGSSKSYQMTCSVMNGSTSVDSSRIGYAVSVEDSAGTASIDKITGKLTITGGSSTGYMTVKVYATVDGSQIGNPRIIKVKVSEAKFDWSLMSDSKITGTITNDGNVDNEATQTIDLAKLYSSNACIRLASWNGNWNTVQTNAKSTLTSLLNTIKSACANSGTADTTALDTAYNKTLELYTKLVTGANGKASKKSDATKSIAYDGENYTYYSSYYYRERSAHSANGAYTQGGTENATGLQWNYSYAGNDSDEFYLNIRCMMDIFNKFYKQALSA